MSEGVTIGVHRLVLREILVDDQIRIECSMEGDGVEFAKSNPAYPSSTGYLLLATMFQLFTDGTAFTEMRKRFGHTPPEVDIETEESSRQ
jgi:hypothetical protein